MISIIITAYNNTQYIKEALDSVIESCGDVECEILLGVDTCGKTLDYISNIKNKLSKKIKIFFFTKKPGTYVIRNTLALLSEYENLLFFDSDDVMKKELVTNVINSLKYSDYVEYGYLVFRGILTLPKSGIVSNENIGYAPGTFGISKKIFLFLNGFEPWVCASDGEFYWRIKSNKISITTLNMVGFYHRRHNNNLTIGKQTGMSSSLRKEYHKKKQEKKNNNEFGPLKKLYVSDYIEFNENIEELKIYYNLYTTNNKKISIIIPTYKNVQFLPECFDSILKSIKDLDCEILVGIDSCQETLKYVKKNRFDSRFKFYFFEKNLGPYVIKNTLATISSSDKILFFDSDDVMLEHMIPEIIDSLDNFKMYKPMYFDFKNENEIKNINTNIKTNKLGEGVFAINKEIFLDFNGFEGWRCAADSDFMSRFYKKNIKFYVGKTISFLRRVHPNSLTVHPETNLSSKLRAHYYGLSKKNRVKHSCDMFITSPYIELDVNELNNQNDVFILQKNKTKELISNLLGNVSVKPEVNYDKINEVISKKGVYDVKSSVKPVRENLPNNRNELMEKKKGINSESLNKILPGKPNRRKNLPNIQSNRKNF